MGILEIENQIIEKLKSGISDLKIEGFPDKPANYQLTHPIGAILVHYQGSNYGTPLSNNPIIQKRLLEFGLTLILKDLRSKNGAYIYLDQIESLLTGFQPECCLKMYPNKDQFLSEDNGIWQYGFSYIIPAQNTET